MKTDRTPSKTKPGYTIYRLTYQETLSAIFAFVHHRETTPDELKRLSAEQQNASHEEAWELRLVETDPPETTSRVTLTPQ